MGLNKILELRKEFINEAVNAPKLFRDLGKVEQYIAESYKKRSFIELIQNADDANSTTFGIYEMNDFLAVANDGRLFTDLDVEALCRSGSSNKIRGDATIGYRGIGFKSVVNLAKQIYIFSGDFSFTFNKKMTIDLLSAVHDVPLIRVPHPYDYNTDPDYVVRCLRTLLGNADYKTFFVFSNIDKRSVLQELEDFDRNSLLFLNNIENFYCNLYGFVRKIIISRRIDNQETIVEIQEGENTDSWEVLASNKDRRDMIALKTTAECIIPASINESVVHSFTPTIEKAGAFIKINGDYSTDPSRKNIDFDDLSTKSLKNAIELLTNMFVEAIEGKIIRRGLFTPFINTQGLEGNKFKLMLYEGIKEGLRKRQVNLSGKNVELSSLRICPEWLNQLDYESVCKRDLAYLSKEILVLYPEMPTFLETIGVPKLYLREALDSLDYAEISVTGAAQITVKLILNSRYDMTNEHIAKTETLKLFQKGKSRVTSEYVHIFDKLDRKYAKYVIDNADLSDLKYFLGKLKIKPGKLLLEAEKRSSSEKDQRFAKSNRPGSKGVSIYRSSPKLAKWRSAERNTHDYLASLREVIAVTDVSAANMGYDFEILVNNGGRLYIEVKSVESFNDPFKMTNNEYSSAHKLADSYVIALVINDEKFKIKFIFDPINTLEFQKHIERWSWLCDDYEGELLDTEDIQKKYMT